MLNSSPTNQIENKKKTLPYIAGLLAIGFAILGMFFHNAAHGILAVIIGIYGVVKENKIGKVLSIFAIVIGILGFVLFNPFVDRTQKANGIYSDQKNGFQITPPMGWVVNKNLSNSIVAFIDRDAGPDSHPAISISLLSSDSNLDDYVNLGISESQGLSGFSLIKKEKIGTGVSSYYLVESLLKMPNGDSLHGLLLVTQAKNDEFFAVTGQSSDPAWSKYGPTIENSLKTFSSSH